MAFYLIKETGEKTYISNNYLRKKLITLSNSQDLEINSVNSNEINDEDYLFFARIGYEIPELSIEKAVSVVLEMIDENSIDEISTILTLEKTHILAIVYLIHEGLMTESDFMRFIKMESTSSRTQMLLEFLARDDEEIDIFAPLLSQIQRKSNYKSKIEASTENEINTVINNLKLTDSFSKKKTIDSDIYESAYSQYNNDLYRYSYNWKYTRPSIVRTVWTTNKIFLKSVSLFSLGGIFFSILRKVVKTIVEYVKVATQVVEYDNTPQYLDSDAKEILSNYYNSVTTELIKDIFKKRFHDSKISFDRSYMSKVFKIAFGEVNNRAWAKFKENQNHTFLWFSKYLRDLNNKQIEKGKLPVCVYSRLLSLVYNDNQIQYINEDEPTETVTYTYSSPDKKINYDDLASYFLSSEKYILKRYLSNSNYQDFNNEIFSWNTSNLSDIFSYPDDEMEKMMLSSIKSFSTTNDFFETYFSFSTGYYRKSYAKIRNNRYVKNLLEANYLIKDKCDTSSSYNYHTISNFGTCKIKKIMEEIITKYITKKIEPFKVSDLYSKTIRERKLNEILSILPDIIRDGNTLYPAKYKFYIPMIYEILNNYIKFILNGNAIYSDEENLASQPGYTDTVFDIAVSHDFYKYYKLLFFIRHTIKDIYAIHNETLSLPVYKSFYDKMIY